MNGLAAVVKIFRCSGMSLQAAGASGCERNFYTAFISIKESNLSLTHQLKKTCIGRNSWFVRIFESSNLYYINKGLPAYMTLGALALA